MAIDINAAKLALCGCTNKKQVMYIVECLAENGSYEYDYDCSVSDNAIYADMQNKHLVAEGLRFVYEGRQFLIIKGKVCANGDDGEPVVVADTNHYFSESKYNAALIAAAPEMYEMLDEISDGLLDAGGFGNCALAKRIEQLLAKARGES